MSTTTHYNRCIHCNNKITNINENYRIETIYDGVYREFRYCCSKCFWKYYNTEYNDAIKTNQKPKKHLADTKITSLKPDAKKHPKSKKGGEDNE